MTSISIPIWILSGAVIITNWSVYQNFKKIKQLERLYSALYGKWLLQAYDINNLAEDSTTVKQTIKLVKKKQSDIETMVADAIRKAE